MIDLLACTAELVDIASVSHDEARIADRIETELRERPGLTIDRVGDNVVARTTLGRAQRIVLAGHVDTVPGNGLAGAVVSGEVVHGLGAADMKGGLAVLLGLAESLGAPPVDVTYVFYAGEEVAAEHNGLGHLFRDRPDLLAGDVAVLGEPTGGALEAGCQGSLRVEIELRGERAHTARPWMGRNAVHRLGRLLAKVEALEERKPVVDGCEYREALQAVHVSGGVAGNVVPDSARVTLNHRFAPDRDAAAAEASLRRLFEEMLEGGDSFTVVDAAPAAAPGLDHPLIAALVERNSLTVRAKLGWTDVARFAAAGIPAANFGPGDPLLAHTEDEWVSRAQLDGCFAALADLISSPPR